jgi:ribosomal protein L44E
MAAALVDYNMKLYCRIECNCQRQDQVQTNEQAKDIRSRWESRRMDRWWSE